MTTQMKKGLGIICACLSFLFSVVPVFAQVDITPVTVTTKTHQLFTLTVPSEKDMSTTGVRVVLPDGIINVFPSVKTGWTLNVRKDGEGSKITEINWTEGNIPPDEEDTFSFSAQVPDKETTLVWKVYQTYQNGDVTSWDQNPTNIPSTGSPYAQTTVTSDQINKAITMQKNENEADMVWHALTMSALVLSVLALGIQLRKRV